MADLGGPLPHRFFGYLVLTVVGVGLIALGTPLAHWTAVAAVAMAVVGFAVRFAGVLGGYYAASGMALTLAFVLAVALPTEDSPLTERLLGWAVGGLAAAVASVALWPAQERRAIREAMAAACDALADFVDTLVTGADDTAVARLESAAAAAVEQAEARFHGSPYRPAGPSAHDRALVSALRHIAWVRDICGLVTATRPVDPADVELLAASSAHLRACGAALTGGAVVTLADEVDVRARHLDALVAAVGDGRQGAASGVARLDQSFAARALSFAVLSLSSDIDAAVGHPVEETGDATVVSPPRRSAGAMVRTAWGTMAAHLRLDSVRFRDAVRVGIGLGVAVAIALAGGLPHAFWVALGTLSVLRSNAMSTGYTVVQSIVGTILGFALAAGVVSVTDQDWFLWALLPVTVFMAAYTPSAVHFVVGQASFTIFVVVLFNLLVPEGWRTGLVRLQDIAIGAAVSLVVSVVLWPRGASAQLSAASSAAIAVGGRYMADAVASRLGRAGGADDDVTTMDRSRRDARAAGRRAAEAYITFLSERGRRRLPLDVAGELLSFGLLVDLTGRALESIPPTPSADGPSAPPPSCSRSNRPSWPAISPRWKISPPRWTPATSPSSTSETARRSRRAWPTRLAMRRSRWSTWRGCRPGCGTSGG